MVRKISRNAAKSSIYLLFMALIFILTNCASLNIIQQSGPLKKARQNLKDGEFGIAIAQFTNIREQSAEPDTKSECTFYLGESYFLLKSYYDSKKEFEKCLRDYPGSKWETRAKDYIEKIKNVYLTEEEILSLVINIAQEKITQLEKEIKNNYRKSELHLDLGHALWTIGQYDNAVKEYLIAIDLDPQLKENPLIKERMIFDLDGNLVPLTPKERVRLSIEKNPIIIFNTYNLLKRDRFGGQLSMYVVTGQVKNQSLRPILDLTIEVTLYNISGNVLDVSRVFVGKIFPGEVRSFASISRPLENVNNVARYECNTFFQR